MNQCYDRYRRPRNARMVFDAGRVHATAAELNERTGNSGVADHHRDLSRATILRLAQSLPEAEPLRCTFLSAPAVAKVLGDAERISRST